MGIACGDRTNRSNKQQTTDYGMPGGPRLLKDPGELAKLTDAEDGKESRRWSKDIGSQFGWGEKLPLDL